MARSYTGVMRLRTQDHALGSYFASRGPWSSVGWEAMAAVTQSMRGPRMMLVLASIGVLAAACQGSSSAGVAPSPSGKLGPTPSGLATATPSRTALVPLSIEYMRAQSYPGSNLAIE